MHQIDDVSFRSSWTITNVALTYQSFGFLVTLQSGQYTLVKSVVGYNIYEVHVPIVSNNVLISAAGKLVQQG